MSRRYRASLIERLSYLIVPKWEVEKEERGYRGYLRDAERKFDEAYAADECPGSSITQFHILGLLRKGEFGFLIQAARRRKLYAMKVMPYGKVERSPESYFHEKKLHYALDSDFTVKLLFTCKNGRNLYLVMEYPHYGDLKWQLTETYIREPVIQLYAAQIVLALEYLHACQIVHRDLREENIWLFEDGYLKVADFRFAKKLSKGQTCPSLSGALLYTAPEMLARESCSASSGWWSFGVLLFSILFLGLKPFGSEGRTRDAEQLLDEISHKELILPQTHRRYSVDLRDITKRLLQKDIGKRLRDAHSIKTHAWFRNLDFFQIRMKRLKLKFPFVKFAEKIEPISPSLVPGPDDPDVLRHDFADF